MRICTSLKTAFGLVFVAAVLAGCAASRPAPVTEARPAEPTAPVPARPTVPGMPATTAPPGGAVATPLGKPGETSKVHVIQRGETMRSIANQYGLDFRELAAWNNIENPSLIRVGDTLRLTRPDTQIVAGSVPPTNVPPSGTPAPSDTSMPSAAAETVATPLVLTPPPAPDRASPLATPSATLKTEPRAAKVPYTDQAYARMLAESGQGAGVPVLSATPTPPLPAAPVPPPPTTPSPSSTPGIGATPPSSATASTPPSLSLPATPSGTPSAPAWAWPVKGNVIAKFTEVNKGIDIAGTKGTPVLAAESGKVIYNEAGMRGYGRLIIIKHSDEWLSAYAHNDKVLVKQNQDVKKGEKIAEMGASDADRVKLHFEIRRQGKPVDPLKYLPPN
jgi:lipoprotein NlpD